MALHPNFPESPHEIIDPSVRWFPDSRTLRDTDYGKLLPPLVHKVADYALVEAISQDVVKPPVLPDLYPPQAGGWYAKRVYYCRINCSCPIHRAL